MADVFPSIHSKANTSLDMYSKSKYQIRKNLNQKAIIDLNNPYLGHTHIPDIPCFDICLS